MDPGVILSLVNQGVAIAANGLAAVNNAIAIILHFI